MKPQGITRGEGCWLTTHPPATFPDRLLGGKRRALKEALFWLRAQAGSRMRAPDVMGAVVGESCTVVFERPAAEAYTSLPSAERARADRLFKRLADSGRVEDTKKFKALDKGADGLFEFKVRGRGKGTQIRFLGTWRSDRRFVVASGFVKKQNKIRPSEIDRAKRILAA